MDCVRIADNGPLAAAKVKGVMQQRFAKYSAAEYQPGCRWMRVTRSATLRTMVLTAFLLSGCINKPGKIHYLGDRSLNYYEDTATEIEYPNVDTPTTSTVRHADESVDVALHQHSDTDTCFFSKG